MKPTRALWIADCVKVRLVSKIWIQIYNEQGNQTNQPINEPLYRRRTILELMYCLYMIGPCIIFPGFVVEL